MLVLFEVNGNHCLLRESKGALLKTQLGVQNVYFNLPTFSPKPSTFITPFVIICEWTLVVEIVCFNLSLGIEKIMNTMSKSLQSFF